MKRIQGLPSISQIQVVVEHVAGESLGNNLKKVVRGITSVFELRSTGSQGIQANFHIPIRKTDTGMFTDVECFGATPQIGVGGAGHGSGNLRKVLESNPKIYAIVNGGVSPSNPFATPTSFGAGGGRGGGFGAISSVPFNSPTPTLDSNVLLVSAGSGGAGGPGFGTAAGSGGTGGTGRPSGDPRSISNAAGGGPTSTSFRYTAGAGNPPTSGHNNNTPGGGPGGAGYYGGSAGAQGVDGGQGTRENNGGGGGAGYISPLIINGQTTGGLSTSPGGRSSINYSYQNGVSEPSDAINSKVIINKHYWMYNVFKVENHKILKSKLLQYFKKYDNLMYNSDNKNSFISNTDWNIQCEREYFNYFLELEGKNYSNFLSKIYPNQKLGFTNFWFQQYERKSGSDHRVHMHKDVYLTNIYFVELEDKSLSTNLVDVKNNSVIKTNANEGEILSFSGDTYHFSPPNFSDYRKTVLVFNINPF